MSDSKVPAQGNDALRDSAPPTQQPHTQTQPSTSSHAQNGPEPHQTPSHEASTPDQAPPAYAEVPGQVENEELGTNAVVADDGRVNIRIDQKSRALSQLILPQIQRQLTQTQEDPEPPPPYVPEFLGGAPGQEPPPPLNVVIQVVGSRGDVQPFVALGKVLKETYGHRVRLATHPTFKDFVIDNGLEFFSIGGDPAELMAFMVKNPGLMPGFDTMRSGDIGKRRKGIAEILSGTWRSCIETGNGIGVDPLQHTVEEWMGIEEQLPEQLRRPFVADAIIANPPAFGHLHCAEKLGIPLHMMFTMPWSPTQQFPHPLANIQTTNADPTITNYMSYIMVDILTWQGLGDIINRFRKESLRLDPISPVWATAMLARLKIPFTYCWSPALIPKPKDWSHHISIAGFYFLNLASNYTPEPDLAAFLDGGEPPVYIGFGSIVVDDPNAMTKMIFDAVKITGRRALVSKGWGGLGADDLGKPDGVFMLGNCPHDWLFKRVSAVVHHGGAGTTAAGIATGKPTVVVPFFGDQAFWGAMVARAGAGPDPIPYKDLTAEKLAGLINAALRPESLERAQELCNKISKEDGTQKGAQSFHQMLNYDEMRCAVMPNKPAVWRLKRTQVKLSAKAATVLAQEGEVQFSEMKLFRPREYVPDEGPIDPVSGATGALMGTITSMMMGVADMPIQTLKLLQIHPDAAKSKKGKEKAASTDNLSVGEGSTSDRPSSERTTTATTERSSRSGANTPTAADGAADLARIQGEPPAVTSAGTPGTPGTPTHRSSFMSQAFSESTQHSRSRSRERLERLRCKSPEEPKFNAATKPGMAENVESAVDTGKGLARMIGAGFKSPMDFSLNVAKGFHNVPKLYGAEVRQVDKVTDFNSGMRTAAKEFGYGLYDGITGIVTDPYKGAKKEGGIGFVKGVGRGIMSVPFRVMGGAWSVPGYAMKGLYQEMVKSKGKSVQNYIIAARIAQGYEEASTVSQQERDAIVRTWHQMKGGIKKKGNPATEKMDSLHSLVQQKRDRKNERSAKLNAGTGTPGAQTSAPSNPAHSVIQAGQYPDPPRRRGVEPEIRSTIPSWRQQEAERTRALQRQTTTSSGTPSTAPPQQSQAELEASLRAEEEEDQRELERAIAASVADSSRGDPEEDRLLASAIRASIAELEAAPAGTTTSQDEEEALRRAMNASMEEAGKTNISEEEQKALEETLRNSLLETKGRRRHGSDSEWNSDADTEEDEEYQRIIAESKQLAHLHEKHPNDFENSKQGAQQESGMMEAMSQAIGAADDEPSSSRNVGVTDEKSSYSQLGQQAPPSHQQGASTTNPPSYQQPAPAAPPSNQQASPPAPPPPSYTQSRAQPSEEEDDEDAQLKKVLAESEQAEKEREKQRTEEDIVMEYVRKQSLLEEEHRQRALQERDSKGGPAAT